METNQIVAQVLWENFNVECETVGPTNVEDIIKFDVEFASSQHGSNTDLGNVLQTLVVATTFIKTALDIYVLVKERTKRELSEAELLIEIATKKEIFRKLDKSTQEKLIGAVIKKIKVIK